LKKETTREKLKRETIDWIIAIIYAVIFGTIIRLFVFETMMVPTPSMVPTLNISDRLFVEKITYAYEKPEVGDIVVFWTPFEDKMAQQMLGPFDKFMDFFAPKEFNGHVKYVKRLIANSGDVIRFVSLNDEIWEEIANKEKENIPLWLNDIVKDYNYNINIIPRQIKNRIAQVEINGETPKIFQDTYYIVNAIFDDEKFYEYMAFPDNNRRNIVESNLFFVYKDNFTGSLSLEKPTIEWFRAYNEIIDYTSYYNEHLSEIEIQKYIFRDDEGFVNVRVPEGYNFYLGDNSMESFDSRFFGFVPEENVIGTTFLRVTPIKDFGKIN
jgi:signal peptidase I